MAGLGCVMPNEVYPSFFERLGLAFRIVFNPALGRKALEAIQREEKPKAALPPEKVHASGLFVLSALQQEGRLVDFLQQDVASFSDDEVGAAARVIHAGCRKTLQQYVSVEPVMKQAEGENVSVPAGFDAQR